MMWTPRSFLKHTNPNHSVRIFPSHRKLIFDSSGSELNPESYRDGAVVTGFSQAQGKPNRRPLRFVVTKDRDGNKRFSRPGLFPTT